MLRLLVTGVLCALTIAAGVAAAAASPVPRGDVAVVAGSPVSTTTWHHWLLVAVSGSASATPGAARIVPVQPPRFASCVARARRQIPALKRTARTVVVRDCAALFRSLNAQVLDFLITARWYIDDAARLGISYTAAQVSTTLAGDRRRQFPTAAAYRAFLRKTGQTTADIRFRVLADLVFKALLAHDHTMAAVDREARALYRARTVCAPLYAISDCRRTARHS
ncbi:MAG: hypothetical protein ABSH51_23250 [Solirubrobacteraceae bacterium]